MLRNEIQRKTGLTRKAMDYYEERGLIKPRKAENGYRDYSEEDLWILNQIALYRKAGLTVSEIEELLPAGIPALFFFLRKKQYQIEMEEKRKSVLEMIVKGADNSAINEKLNAIEKEETLYSKLERAFPGYFGQMIFSAYQPFLNEPLKKDGEKAYNKYVNYLDELPPFELSVEEQEYIRENTAALDWNDFKALNDAKRRAIESPEKWWRENNEAIARYEQFKTSEEYLTSPMKRIWDKLKQYMQDNHYYETAIPLIRKFSQSYDEYYSKLLAAKTGALDGRRATTNKRAFDWVKSIGPKVNWERPPRWVRDGKFYTSAGVSAGIDMALGFIQDQYGAEKVREICGRMEYHWNANSENELF